MGLHSGIKILSFKHDIACITANDSIASQTLKSVIMGRFNIDIMVKIVEAENPEMHWNKKHRNAMESLASNNKATQALILEAGLQEKPRKGKGGKGRGRGSN